MYGVFLGIANNSYDSGYHPSCAINSAGQVVEVHTAAPLPSGLWYNFGQLSGTELKWLAHGTINKDNGVTPSVAMNAGGLVLEAHCSGHGTLWYWIGQVQGNNVTWSGHGQYDDGVTPSVALQAAGQYVEVHDSGHGTLWYSVGQVSGGKLTRTDHNEYTDGVTPSAAINASGLLVEVHNSGQGALWYRVGRVSGGKLTWLGASTWYDNGISPSVALTDDGYVVETHQSQSFATLYQRLGQVIGGSINWIDLFAQGQDSYYFDDGAGPSVSCNSAAAVQVHSSGSSDGLFSTASYWLDRSNWMGQNSATLGPKPLKSVVLPATHDAGMYLGSGLSVFGKTQELDILGQLNAGVRYFDLRPADDNGTLIIYHGKWGGIHVNGPPLNDVLFSVARFLMDTGPRPELIILKFSHYGGFTQTSFDTLFSSIYSYLQGYLYTGSPPPGSRLADMPLNTLIAKDGTVLIVCDGTFTPPTKPPGLVGAIKVYRDWFAPDPQNGDLTVFDVYSDTTDLNTMLNAGPPNPDPPLPNLPRGQLPKFAGFNGTCLNLINGKPVPCDLFLLSWTLTPPTAVWPFSRTANAALGPDTANLGPNPRNLIVNLLYVDYVEYARACDVAVLRNGVAPTPV